MSFLAFMAVAIVAWMLAVWMVWKKKTGIFNDRMEQALAEKRLKRLKVSLLVAGISLAVGIANIIVGIIVLGYEEEAVIFYIGLFSVLLFIAGNISGFVIYITGRQ